MNNREMHLRNTILGPILFECDTRNASGVGYELFVILYIKIKKLNQLNRYKRFSHEDFYISTHNKLRT